MAFSRALFASGSICALLLSAAFGTAQLARDLQNSLTTGKGEENRSPYTLKVDASLVSVDVVVTDDGGRFLTGLKRGNFRILDDGVPQQIVSFSPTTNPITIVMLLEYSSRSSSYFASRATYWGWQFLEQLEPQDWVALITYDLKPTVQVDFTHDRAELRGALSSLGRPAFSEISLFDALLDTLDKLDSIQGRKSILLLTTGADTLSAATLEDVLKRLKQTDVTIFPVSLAEQEYIRYGNADITYMQSRSWLETFAKRTGGLSFFPRFDMELPDACRSIAGFLRSEYTLTFRPPEDRRDGRFHSLKVEIVASDGKPLRVTDEKGRPRKFKVFAREGYTAPTK